MTSLKELKKNPINKEVEKMLQESNYVEGEYTLEALGGAKEAWAYAVNHYNDLTTKAILKIHKLLMQRLRPDIAGKIRDCPVWIDGEIKPFINEKLILADLQMKVCFEMIAHNTGKKELRAKKAKDTHIAFEYIHPFEDGNGRVGRILYNIHRLRMRLPIHIIHSGDEQMKYYGWFNVKFKLRGWLKTPEEQDLDNS